MAPDYEQIVRGIYEQWGRGNFSAGTERFTDRTTLFLQGDLPDAGTYRGPEAIRGYMRGFLAHWDSIVIEAVGFSTHGNSVIAEVRQSATGSGSGAPVAFDYFQVWSFEGETVARLDSIRERADALEAAGAGPDRTEGER